MNYGKIGKIMKYIEELNNGECFVNNNVYYFVTSDFKKNGQRLCYNLVDGSPKWMEGTTIASVEPLYILDKDNNVIAVRPTLKTNDLAN